MSFFDEKYQTPEWLKAKLASKINRRQMLKSAAGASAIGALSQVAWANGSSVSTINTSQEPWRTLDKVLEHLLPESNSGPGAKSVQALQYLHNVVTQQPIDEQEKEFIRKGVSWLNGYSQSEHKQDFIGLNSEIKESTLRAISRSQAGHNWINTLINYLYEAMLSPPVYGGNPNGIGWQWLEHQAGFPLPNKGTRYYELPGSYKISVKNINERSVRNEEKAKS